MEEGTPFQDSSFVCAVSVKRILSSLASRGGRGLAAAICMPEGFPPSPSFYEKPGGGINIPESRLLLSSEETEPK